MGMASRSIPRNIELLTAIAGIVLTIVLGLWSARPWGDNCAYQDAGDYLMLAGFLAWAVAPYAYFILLPAEPRRGESPLARLVVTLLICGLGMYVVIDAVLIHPGAQSAMVFIFAALYQWAMIVLYALVIAVLARLRSSD